MTRLYLIRHGQTGWNAEARLQGQSDSALSDLGRVEIERLAQALADVPLRAVYSSPLSRARLTASAVAARHGLAVITVDALKEINLGNWEGLTVGEVAARHPARLAARRADPLRVAPEGGETIADVHARVLPAVRKIVAAHPGETVAIVAHGAVNKTVLLDVLGAPLASYGSMHQDNAAINVVDWDGAARRVLVVNETAHLDGRMPPRPDSAETPRAPRVYTPRLPRE